MAIDEAIEILQSATVGVGALDDPDLPAAIKLGIEALKRLQAEREKYSGWSIRPLPGETED